VLIYLRHADGLQAKLIVEKCLPVIAATGSCHVFLHRSDEGLSMGALLLAAAQIQGSDKHCALRQDVQVLSLVQLLEEIKQWAPRAAAVSFSGGSIKHLGRKLTTRLSEQVNEFGASSLLWVLPALAVLLPFMLVTNLCLRTISPSGRPVRSCSSMLILISTD
jgi:hypothetical protein